MIFEGVGVLLFFFVFEKLLFKEGVEELTGELV